MDATGPDGVQCVVNGYGGASEPIDVVLTFKNKLISAPAATGKATIVPQATASELRAVTPTSGTYVSAGIAADSLLNVSVSGQGAQFAIASQVRGDSHECMLEGRARVESSVLKYGPDDDKCSATISYYEGAIVVETANCNSSCGMKAMGTMDGSYTLRK